MKRCTCCTIEKPLEEFYWANKKKTYRHSKCHECRRNQFKQWAKTEGGKKTKRNGILRRNFGLTREQYETMYKNQNGLCAICKKEEIQIRRGSISRLSVDHHHETRQVRGLLCSCCNMGLGSFGENIKTMELAIEYIVKHKQAAKTEQLEKELKK